MRHPRAVTVQVPAKVNLHLSVGDLRPDGYHDLTTVFQALSLHDEVTVSLSDRPGVEVVGVEADAVPSGPSNLAWRAVLELAEVADREPGVRVVIRKEIPVAGGMAGGSADAAAALVGLAALWRLPVDRVRLAEVAARLGSDVAFPLLGGVAVGTGRGERLTRVPVRPRTHWVLAQAERGLSTPLVFAELDRLRAGGPLARAGGADDLLAALGGGDPRAVAPFLANDLQAAALSLRPELADTLAEGLAGGALAGLVSGSGPTCAFLCADRAAAGRVAGALTGGCRAVRVAHGPVPGATVVGDRWGTESKTPGRKAGNGYRQRT